MINYDEEVLRMVEEFQSKFNPPKTREFWMRLINEEVKELLNATDAENELKEFCDVIYVVAGFHLATGELPEKEAGTLIGRKIIAASEIMDALRDQYSEGTIFEAFKRVHESNMSKLGEDGKPVRREDGKIMKGPNYKPAVLADLVG